MRAVMEAGRAINETLLPYADEADAMLGKGAALTTLTGIVMRVVRWGTASTSGTGITPPGSVIGGTITSENASSCSAPSAQ